MINKKTQQPFQCYMPKIDVFGLFIREYVHGLENEEDVGEGSGLGYGYRRREFRRERDSRRSG